MKSFVRRLSSRTAAKARKPVIIDCIGPLTLAFAETFEQALAGVDIAFPVHVQLKRASLPDMRGFNAMAETIDRRRTSGGDATYVTPSSRWRTIFQQNGIPSDRIRADEDASANRRIILAVHAG